MSASTRFLILPPLDAEDLPANAAQAGENALTTQVSSAKAAEVRQKLRAIISPVVAKGGKSSRPKAQSVPESEFQVVATIKENGVQLVSASPEMAAAYRFLQPGARIAPEMFYELLEFVPRVREQRGARSLAAGTASVLRKLEVEVVRADTQKPVGGVNVAGFTDFERREGDEGKTKANGKVTLEVAGKNKTYERLYIRHDLPGLWSHLFYNQSTDGALRIELRALDLAKQDSLRHLHTLGQLPDGQSVKVGVIDSGIAKDHADLQVSGGWGCVAGEPETEWGPHGSHGTHVAGIIAGRGAAPGGIRGMAPSVTLYSYRVFGPSQPYASNFSLVQAIERGIADGCDLLNLSLGFNPDKYTGQISVDLAVRDAIRKAYRHGILVIAAAGNDGRKAVRYPASDALAVAVSAVGRKGLFPADATAQGDILAPYGTDPKDFVGAFSNVGTEISAAGAGVAVVSTVPGGYAPKSGTSMACPAVTGVVARLLAQNDTVLKMARDARRATAIKQLLFSHARSLGFKIDLEGKGLPK